MVSEIDLWLAGGVLYAIGGLSLCVRHATSHAVSRHNNPLACLWHSTYHMNENVCARKPMHSGTCVKAHIYSHWQRTLGIAVVVDVAQCAIILHNYIHSLDMHAGVHVYETPLRPRII